MVVSWHPGSLVTHCHCSVLSRLLAHPHVLSVLCAALVGFGIRIAGYRPSFRSRKYCTLCSGCLLLWFCTFSSSVNRCCHLPCFWPSVLVVAWGMATVFVNSYLFLKITISSWGCFDFPSFLLAVFCIYMRFVVDFVAKRCFYIRDMCPSMIRVSLDFTVSSPPASISFYSFVDRGVHVFYGL